MARRSTPRVSPAKIWQQLFLLGTSENATPREGCDSKMSSALTQMARMAPRSRSWCWTAVAAITLLFCGSAWAQTANDARAAFGGNAKARSAYAEWRRLSQNEVNCVDQS